MEDFRRKYISSLQLGAGGASNEQIFGTVSNGLWSPLSFSDNHIF